MKADIKQLVSSEENGYKVIIKAHKDGELLFTINEDYMYCNIIFAAYKSLFKTINRCDRYGIKELLLDSNVPQVLEEISGNENVNSRLLDILRERMEAKQVCITVN